MDVKFELKTIGDIVSDLLEAKLPDEGETFKVTKDIQDATMIDKNMDKVLDKKQDIKMGVTLEVQMVTSNEIIVSNKSDYFVFSTKEWNKLPLRLL